MNIWSDLLVTISFLLYTPAWHQVPFYGSLPWYFNDFVPISTYFLFSWHLSLNNNSFFHIWPYYIQSFCITCPWNVKKVLCQKTTFSNIQYAHCSLFAYSAYMNTLMCVCQYSMCQHMYLCNKHKQEMHLMDVVFVCTVYANTCISAIHTAVFCLTHLDSTEPIIKNLHFMNHNHIFTFCSSYRTVIQGVNKCLLTFWHPNFTFKF
jgi:hypothetical protein